MNKLVTALSLWLIAGSHGFFNVTTGGSAGTVVPTGAVRSAEGTCTGFKCDHATVAHLDDGKVLLQFTEYAGHYLSLVGRTSDGDHINLDEEYLDGLRQPRVDRQCSLVFKASGELSEIICPSLTFTATKDSK